MDGFEQLLISNVSAITTCGGFLLYLYKKSQMDRETYKDFNATIQNHLAHSNLVIKDNTAAKILLAKQLQKLDDSIMMLNGKKRKRVK